MFMETGAIGDMAIGLCRAFAGMIAEKHSDVIVHVSQKFRTRNFPLLEYEANPNAIKILENCSFVKEICFDCDYNKKNGMAYSKKHSCKIEEPKFGCDFIDIRKYLALYNFIPDDFDLKGKIALFQPISLKSKPSANINEYIPVWNECLEALLSKGYKIVMVGAKNDPYHVTFDPKYEEKIINKCGKWSMLQSVAYLLYRCDLVVSCDSWAAMWGIACRLPTLAAWGYRMREETDFWLLDFLGNKDCYKYGWSNEKEKCDEHLAKYIASLQD
jgi:hypothetical protein